MKASDDRKKYLIGLAKNYLLITVGCFVLAAGAAIFITPNNLVTGGLSSIAIIVQYFINKSGSTFMAVDLVNWALQLLFLGISFIFLGKHYTIRTVYSSLVYPLFFSLLYRLPLAGGMSIGNYVYSNMYAGGFDYAILLLAGIFGGALVGTGVAISYAGGGTTGGLDVLSVIIAKHTPVKEGFSSFLMDGSLVLAGLFIMKDINRGLIGILSAATCGLLIQIVYVRGSSFIIADIITEKPDEIRKYVETEMDRTTTIIAAKGGYTQQDKPIVRVAFSRREAQPFKSFIARTDPHAFVTLTTASMINGEGFVPLVEKNHKKRKKSAKTEEKDRN